jgi:hypothetical protein
MAQAVEQHTPIEWSLTKVHRYLTGALGHEKKRALYMMEQCRLVERLPIKVQKFVDDKPEGGSFDLPTDKTHELVHYQGWVYPRGLPWGDYRCTVTEQNTRALWPAPSTAQSSQESPKPKAEGWQVRRVKQALKELFPDGHPPLDLPQKTILDRVNEFFPQDWKPASRDTLARAMGRRRA